MGKRSKVLWGLLVLVIILMSQILTNQENINYKLKVTDKQFDSEYYEVNLNGKIIKYPFEIFRIKGNITIGNEIFKLKSYRESIGSGEIFYKYIEFIDNDYDTYVSGQVIIPMDNFPGIKNIEILITKTDPITGFAHSERIECKIIDI